MIDVYTTVVQAVDEDQNILFTLEMQDAHCCTMTITNALLLSYENLEETLEAVRAGVKLLKLEQS
jgi:hypothetical protein